jgi:hypothetical protein
VQGTQSRQGNQPSALLHCLSRLNSDVWVQVLLPKLVEQRSAEAVALTCSQLRDLCYSSIQSIDLRRLFQGVDHRHIESWMQGLPLHFPNCTAVSLELRSEASYHTVLFILPALARWVNILLEVVLGLPVLWPLRDEYDFRAFAGMRSWLCCVHTAKLW